MPGRAHFLGGAGDRIGLQAAITTFVPAAANASAITRPRPLEPPVTRTVLSFQKAITP